MADEPEKEKGFRVEDRRASKADESGEEKVPHSEDVSNTGKGTGQDQPQFGDSGDGLKVDFSTFVFSLFSSALIQLGDMADPITGKMDPNLSGAKQTIDIVDVLRLKTEGNLTDEESKLLENASAELKWKYLDAVKKKD